MQHFWSLNDVHLDNAWLTIGSFDGVHTGHQEIIRELTAGAHTKSAPAVVLTFYPHPAVVLGKREDPFYLTTPEERAELLGKLGIDVVITHPFNRQVASTSAHDFMADLKSHLNLTNLWVGHDFAMGRGREGNVPRLRELGKEFGYRVHIVEPVEVDGGVVSSSRIRAALKGGDVELARRLLGRPYGITGEVVPGDGRGRSIGIPTANLQVWSGRAIPKAGVYVSQVQALGRIWGAVTNIGIRPTFKQQAASTTVETHILDFDGDLYGKQIQLTFISRLREEKRFSSVQALVEQIHEDIERGRELLGLKV